VGGRDEPGEWALGSGSVIAGTAGVVAFIAAGAQAGSSAQVDSGDTAWMLAAAALVMFMTPGLAFFYGGLVRTKNVLATIMYSFAALALVTLVWTLVGHTLAFGPDVGAVVGEGGWIGGVDFVGFRDVGAEPHPLAPTIPHLAFAVYQLMFAIITPALISGAFAERMRFSGYLVFTALWVILVYAPLAHWVWGGGFLGPQGIGALDFAGGTVVHLNAGVAALAAALVIGARRGWPRPAVPHNVPFVVLGASILWFGWFGFNAGSALAAGPLAASAFVATQLATAAAVFGWVLPEWILHGRPTTVGAATGAVAGLVAITPASGYVRPWAALLIGLAAGFVCELAVGLKHRLRYDDALDVVAVHGVGGALGALLTGVFATTAVNPGGAQGLLYGNPWQVGRQAAAVGVTLLWSFLVSLVILKLLDRVMALRVSEQEEVAGLDFSQHAEAGYTFVEYGAAAPSSAPPGAPSPASASGAAAQPPAEAGPRISFSKNLSAATPASPAYQVRIRAGELDAELGVWREPRPEDLRMREAYWTEVLGTRLERANLPALETALRRLLVRLLPSGRVPHYLLRAPGGLLVPVFEEGGVLRASLEGHHSEAADLSHLRRAVSEWLAEPGAPHGPIELEILLLDQELRGVGPIGVFRDGDLWFPVFSEPPGVVCAGVAGHRLEAEPDLEGMLALREQVAERLLEAGELRDAYDLAITTLAPATWTGWTAGLERVGELWVSLAEATASLHRSGRQYLAAVQEQDGTLAVWCGRDRFDVTSRIQRKTGRRFILV
jgi:ammonium transporter, Amt family